MRPAGNATTYTECDSIPRVRFHSPPTSTITTTVTETWTTLRKIGRYVLSSDGSAIPEYEAASKAFEEVMPPEPKCVIDKAWCQKHRQDYLSERLKTGAEDLDLHIMADSAPEDVSMEGPCPAVPVDCALEMDQEVVLLYWPEHLISRDICAVNGLGTAVTVEPFFTTGYSTVVDAISFRGPAIQQITFWNGVLSIPSLFQVSNPIPGSIIPPPPSQDPVVLKGPFTFTYPTVYLAHHAITATPHYLAGVGFQNVSGLPATRSPGVVSLLPDDIYTMAPVPPNSKFVGVQYAQSAARGLLGEGGLYTYPRWVPSPLDLRQIQDPVPASLFYNARTDCWGTQSHCGTITDDSYPPRLVLKNKVWLSMIPRAAFGCRLPVIVDPPIALRPISGPLPQLHLPEVTSVPDMPGRHPDEDSPQPAHQTYDVLAAPTGVASNEASPDQRNPPVATEGSPSSVAAQTPKSNRDTWLDMFYSSVLGDKGGQGFGLILWSLFNHGPASSPAESGNTQSHPSEEKGRGTGSGGSNAARPNTISNLFPPKENGDGVSTAGDPDYPNRDHSSQNSDGTEVKGGLGTPSTSKKGSGHSSSYHAQNLKVAVLVAFASMMTFALS
jgi:hypothetical protein